MTVSKAMTEARVKAADAAAAKVRPLAGQIAARVMPGNDLANAALPDGAVAKAAYAGIPKAEIRKGIDASVTALSTSTDKWLQNFRTEGKSRAGRHRARSTSPSRRCKVWCPAT